MLLGVCIGQVEEFFNPIQHGRLKKIQPNPTQPTWIGLGKVRQFFFFFLITIIIIIIIIIKLSIRTTPTQIRANL